MIIITYRERASNEGVISKNSIASVLGEKNQTKNKKSIGGIVSNGR